MVIIICAVITRCHNPFSLLSSEPYLLEGDSGFFLPEQPAEPEFTETESNATGQLGGSVFLHCPVVNSGDRAVSYPSVS
jgi:hypothetical protein